MMDRAPAGHTPDLVQCMRRISSAIMADKEARIAETSQKITNSLHMPLENWLEVPNAVLIMKY